MNRLERLARLEKTLRRARTGTLVLAIGNDIADQVAIQGVCSEVAGHEVEAQPAAALAGAEPGGIVLVQLSRLDFTALNLERTLLRERRLRVVIWAAPLLAAHFAHEAPDLYSWIQLTLSWTGEPTQAPIDSPHRVAGQAEAARQRGAWEQAAELLKRCLALDIEAHDERAATWDRDQLARLAERHAQWAESDRWRDSAATLRLSGEELHAIVDAALECGLEEPMRRHLLLVDLPVRHQASLAVLARPRDQLLSDLHALNQLPALKGLDQLPLALWLQNAERLTPRPEAQVFRDARARLAGLRPAATTTQPLVNTHNLAGGSAGFVGRDTELTMLDAAWRSLKVRVQSIIAWGGVGKTALMRHWLNTLADRGYDGAARVYAWSFSSQGAAESRQASADLFIDQMLRWLGDPKPEEGDPWQKGERLAGLIRRQKTLLLLDGVEPLQHPPGPQFGRLKDPALATLLKCLADQMDGLCLASSWIPLTDLAGHGGFAEHPLDHLSAEAGAELLRQRGVKGTEDELQAAAEAYRGHALALRLLGGYLHMYEKGNVHRREVMPPLLEAEDGGEDARRVMQAYQEMLEPLELNILQVVGLFDRTADIAALKAVLAAPGVDSWVRRHPAGRGGPDAGETPAYPGGKPWRKAIAHLRKLGLLEETESDDLDAHPLVREHFGGRLRETAPEVWQAAHERLYRHFAAAAPEFPETLEAMEPLFRAVAHGCAAGRHVEAFAKVYLPRIQRGDEAYLDHRLGATSTDLTLLVHFFAEPWLAIVPSLLSVAPTVLSAAGYCLRGSGRLKEAIDPMEAALDWWIAVGDQSNSALAASNLSEMLLLLGRLDAAEVWARKALLYAEPSLFESSLTRVNLAEVRHLKGYRHEAEALFLEAEAFLAEAQPHLPLLYSTAGYRFGDLLLAEGRTAEVQRRSMQTLPWMIKRGLPLEISLEHLLLGRAAADLADFTPAAQHLDAAVTGLRKAGTQDHLPRGLLARAALHRRLTHFDLAHRDLTEAHTIATRGGMRLYLCDYHLESARLHLAQNHLDLAREHHAVAHAEVHAMGYHRRDPELAELAAALGPPRSA